MKTDVGILVNTILVNNFRNADDMGHLCQQEVEGN